MRRREIRDELIRRHLRLVLHIGKGYDARLPLDEIFSIGTLALTQAAERWDPSKGSIYQWARRWITTALTKAVDAARTIRLPEAVATDAAHIAIRQADAEARLGRQLTAAERLEITGGRPTFDSLPNARTSLELQLETPDGVSGGEMLRDTIPDPKAAEPSEQMEIEERSTAVFQALSELDETEQAVIAARFGMSGERQTLAALGKVYGVSAEAMRRIEASALAKLRHPALVAKIGNLL